MGRVGRLFFVVAMCASVMVGTHSPARAVSQGDTIQTYPPGYPQDITQGPDGAMWFADIEHKTIGRIALDGTESSFAIPSPGRPEQITRGDDGNLWYLASSPDRIGRMTTAGAVTEFPVADACAGCGLVNVPGGDIWFVTFDGGISRITSAGAITNFGGFGSDLMVGPDGNIWFVTNTGVGNITSAGAVSTYSNTGAAGIASGPDGNVWVSHGYSGVIDRLDSSGATVGTMTLPDVYRVNDMLTGPDGAMWLGLGSAVDGYGYVTRVQPDGSLLRFEPEVGLGDGSPRAFAVGPAGTLWFVKGFYQGGLGRLSVPGATQTAVTASTTTSDYPEPVTFTATVTSPLSAATPTGGYVQFYQPDSTPFEAPVPLVNGTATMTTTKLNGGHDVVFAHYLGDGAFLGSWAARTTSVDVKVHLKMYAEGAVAELVPPRRLPLFRPTVKLSRADGYYWYNTPVDFKDALGNVLCSAYSTSGADDQAYQGTATCSVLLNVDQMLAIVNGGGYTATVPTNGVYLESSIQGPVTRLTR